MTRKGGKLQAKQACVDGGDSGRTCRGGAPIIQGKRDGLFVDQWQVMVVIGWEGGSQRAPVRGAKDGLERMA